ncbi:MAG: hypothetical protein WC073_11090 [Sterolibacterium sp.]
MRYPIRRIHGDGKLIGSFVSFNGKIEPMLLGEYFYETPRINPWPPITDLSRIDITSMAAEVLRKHTRIEIGGMEETPDLPDPMPDWMGAWMAIKIWLRGEA